MSKAKSIREVLDILAYELGYDPDNILRHEIDITDALASISDILCRGIDTLPDSSGSCEVGFTRCKQKIRELCR